MSIMRTGLLIAGLTALFGAVGFMLGGQSGMLVALAIATAMNLFAYWNSDKIVLKIYKARLIDPASNPELHAMIRDLSVRAGIPVPKSYIIDNEQPNAFATGRNPENGAVAVTTGLMRVLNKRELAGVIAHELAHIKNRDTLIMTITATIAGAISMLANFAMFFGGGNNNRLGPIAGILLAILAPMAAMLVQMAISRTREYAADKVGAEICGDPEALAAALAKISNAAQRIDNYQAENNPATAHMFIINPLHVRSMDNLFSTHPKTENRIRALREMQKSFGLTPSPWSKAA